MFYNICRRNSPRYRRTLGKEVNRYFAPVVLIFVSLLFMLTAFLVVIWFQSTVANVNAPERETSLQGKLHEDQVQILVMGMSRSGTSLTTSIVAALGANWKGTGPAYIRLMEKKNPKGYFERKDLVDLNYRLLRHLGVRWNSPHQRLFELSKSNRKEFLHFAQAIIADMNNHNPWVLKDCRFSLTLPYWAPLLQKPICIVVFRHPLEVKSSSITKSTAVWETYTTSALRNTQHYCAHRLLVSYASLLSDPVGAVTELQETLIELLGVGGLKMLTETEALEIVDPNLHHEMFSLDETEGLKPSEICLWKALLDRTALNKNFTCE